MYFCKDRKFAVSVDGLPSLDKIMRGSQDSQLVTAVQGKTVPLLQAGREVRQRYV